MKPKSAKKSPGKSPPKKSSSSRGSLRPHPQKLPRSPLPAPLSSDESQEIVLAIRRGKVDALVMAGKDGDEVLVLQNTDQPYRVLVETINDGVATLDASGLILYANRRMAAILRAPFDNFIGSSLLDHVSPTDRDTMQALIKDGLSNSATGEITQRPAEGRPRLVRLALNPIKDSNPPTACIVATELTEMVEANEALRVNEESLRQLSGRLLKLQDEERRRIARDLHDVTGQKLAVQSMCLSQLLSAKSGALDADSQRVLSECAMLNKQIGDEVRTLSYLLYPPLLDELGLSSAVKWYTEGFERRTGIHVKVDIAPNFVRLPPDAEVTLFRIVQESLSNVHRYSGSARASIQIKVHAGEIELTVADFGKGMHHALNSSTGKVAPLGVGIQGMKERIHQLGGKLEITSQPGKGTSVTATMPLATPEAVAAPPASSTA